jgi:hypothetical protein
MIGRGGNPSDLGIQPPVLMHFDGTHWQDVPITLPEGYTNSDFTGISLVSAQEGFISGYSLTYAGPDAPLFFYHLHLGHWEVATLPENQALQNAASGTIRMVSATEGWAFTIKLSGVRGALTTTILHYANGVWSVFE